MSQIVVIDAGGQYCHLITRRVREAGVRAEIRQPDQALPALAGARGVIVSGGPSSVYAEGAPRCPRELFELGLPVLGICYGHHLMAHTLGGVVEPGQEREYGHAELQVVDADAIFRDVPAKHDVWMSHGDEVRRLPAGFQVLARTESCPVAAMADPKRKLFGLQFHPEVEHSAYGTAILNNFLFRICECEKDWDVREQLKAVVDEIRAKVGGRNVLFFVSGGVDSTVAFTLCTDVLGPERVRGVFVDTGVMRLKDREQITGEFERRGWHNVRTVSAEDLFVGALSGVFDPEEKRKRIGEAFVEVQRRILAEEGLSHGDWMLGQGTIYPDTIESGGSAGAAVIKTHHNRVAAVEELEQKGLVVEPIRSFYKDEVRVVGRQLELPPELTDKHPFPGPGLAVRCLCSAQALPVKDFPEVDEIAKPYGFTSWAVPLKTVGVQGDYRSYHDLVVLRGTDDVDRAGEAAVRITRAVRGTNRVALLLYARSEGRPDVIRTQVERSRLDLLRQADWVAHEVLREHDLLKAIWQFPVVLAPISFGGGEAIALRPVCSSDGMTARFAGFAELPQAVVREVTRRIAAIPGVDAVLYDVTNKPPGTIEWE